MRGRGSLIIARFPGAVPWIINGDFPRKPCNMKCTVWSRGVQDAVRLCDVEGVEFARGLCNYACMEVERMKVGKCLML